MPLSLIRLSTTEVYRAWLKSEYLFRTCSVATNMVTSLQIHSDLYYYFVSFLANYETISHSFFFTPIVALLQAVLQNENGTVLERPTKNEEQNSTG